MVWIWATWEKPGDTADYLSGSINHDLLHLFEIVQSSVVALVMRIISVVPI
jgi:hypothetical protein